MTSRVGDAADKYRNNRQSAAHTVCIGFNFPETCASEHCRHQLPGLTVLRPARRVLRFDAAVEAIRLYF